MSSALFFRLFCSLLTVTVSSAFLTPCISLSGGARRNLASSQPISSFRMAFSIPEHFKGGISADTVDGSFHSSERLLGVTDSWLGSIEKRTHFDTEALLQTGVLQPTGQGRAVQWSRRVEDDVAEYVVWEVLEPGAVARGQETTTRSSDGHAEHKFTSSATAVPQNLVLEANAATWAGGWWASGAESEQALTVRMQLCQPTESSASGYKQAVSIAYDPRTGALCELCRSEQCAIPAELNSPEVPVDFDKVSHLATPSLGEEVAYVSYSCMGNPLGDLVDRARWKGRASIHTFPDGVGGPEKSWKAEEGTVAFTSMCFREVQRGAYSDIRFADGAYLRLPLGVTPADEEVVLEFGALRRDKGIHRTVALGSRAKGFHSLSYERFS